MREKGNPRRLLPYSLHHIHCLFSIVESNVKLLFKSGINKVDFSK